MIHLKNEKKYKIGEMWSAYLYAISGYDVDDFVPNDPRIVSIIE